MAIMAMVSLNGTSPGFNVPPVKAIKSKKPEMKATAISINNIILVN